MVDPAVNKYIYTSTVIKNKILVFYLCIFFSETALVTITSQRWSLVHTNNMKSYKLKVLKQFIQVQLVH